MATKKTSIYTNQENRNIELHTDQSIRDVVTGVVIVRGTYTCDGTEANTDVIKLCIPRIGGYLLPEASRITNRGSGDCDLDLTLRKVAEDGTATAISGASSVDNNSVAVTRLSTAPVEMQIEDELEFLISNRDASAADEVIDFELVFACIK